jgi:hypothetical protein
MPPKRTEIAEVCTDWMYAFRYAILVIAEAKGLPMDKDTKVDEATVEQALRVSEATLGKVRFP